MEPDPFDRPVQEPPHGHRTGGLLAMVAGLTAVFATGTGFDLFGNPIAFSGLGAYLFFGSIWLGVFGLVWCFASVWTAFYATVIVAGVFLALFFAGGLSPGEM